jgi:2-oxoacid:acceptor oxidoreductase delta subunit (pyruvate/2-ketoisovalerate family)
MAEKKTAKKIEFKGESDMPPMAMSLGLMDWNKTGSWRNLRPVIDYEKCIRCMICWKFCPDACIHIEDDKPVIDYQYCKGCVICAVECPKDAISVEKEE